MLVAHRGAGRNRTDEWRFCRPLPYHLATAPMLWANNLARLLSQPQGRCGRSCGHSISGPPVAFITMAFIDLLLY